MSKSFTLYGRQGSGSFAVQVALEEIGAPYERLFISQEPADVARLREVNPTGKVPALKCPDGTVLFESAAMLIHLALLYPGARLAPPPGTSRHGLFLQWMVFLSANLYEAVLRMFYSARYSTRGEADSDVISQQGTADYLTHAALISQSLHPYVLGTEYSIADVYLYMIGTWYPKPAELHARLPALAAHTALLKQRPAIVKVEADHADPAAT
jgi:glutathione S-transferase